MSALSPYKSILGTKIEHFFVGTKLENRELCRDYKHI